MVGKLEKVRGVLLYSGLVAEYKYYALVVSFFEKNQAAWVVSPGPDPSLDLPRPFIYRYP
jgi:hypothetical protein